MSSRAMRKLQREEEQNRLAKLEEKQDSSEDDADGGDVDMNYASTAKVNAFDLLNVMGDNAGTGGVSNEGQESVISSDEDEASQSQQRKALQPAESHTQNQSQAKKKKKSKKKKNKAQKIPLGEVRTPQPGHKTNKATLDEIDLALLSLKGKASQCNSQDDGNHNPGKELLRLYTLLATNVRNLNALNEMKKLFGDVVFEEENQGAARPGPGRRGNRHPNAADLGGALAARNSPVSRGKGLAGLALRRNVFMIGKESWPKATSGGLSMEVVEKPWDLTTEFGFVHNKTYQDVQRQFNTCVDSMDPERMIELLQFNPYHISTLLVVSEIYEHQGDHTFSGELLERALFSYGRSVHSTFSGSIAEGKARMDFRLVENREFWLVAWRYITHLGQRGTWRTAYEWAKLLLSFDPEGDPYCVRLILDQLALRGGQSENFVELAALLDTLFSWGRNSPNIQISLGLAQYRLKRVELCRTVLRSAVKDYPWVFLRLFQELNISSTPKAIWGKLPQSEHAKLEMEAYVARAKDLWNTPEAISLLVEVVESVDEVGSLQHSNVPISRNEARHILLSGVPSLVSLLPRDFTTAPASSIDVLPPIDSYSSYHLTESDDDYSNGSDDEDAPQPPTATARPRPPREGDVIQEEVDGRAIMELRGVQRVFARFLPFLANRGAIPDTTAIRHTVEELEHAVNVVGMTPDEFATQARQLFELSQQFEALREGDEGEEEDYDEDEEMPDLESASDDNGSAADAQEVADAGGDHGTALPNPEIDNSKSAQPLPGTPQSSGSTTTPPAAPTLLQKALQELNSQVRGDFINPHEAYDEDRNKHWLAGRGIRLVEAFIYRYGADESDWLRKPECSYNNPVLEFAKRLKLLTGQTRTFFLKYVLQQQIDSEARDLVKRIVDTQEVLSGTGEWREGHVFS